MRFSLISKAHHLLTLSSLQWEFWLKIYLWPFFRILAWVATDPVFGIRAISARVKIGWALLLTVMLGPWLGSPPEVALISVDGLLITTNQILIGCTLGFSLRLVFSSLELAGHLVGMQAGLGFATFFDPQHSAQVPILAQVVTLMTTLSYFAMNGHWLMLMVLAKSFAWVPVSAAPLRVGGWSGLLQWSSLMWSSGLLLAMPVVASLLIANLALALMTRAAPQLNIFAVGFPITLFIGLLFFYFSLPYLVLPLQHAFNDVAQVLAQALPAMSGTR